jgi:cytochrome d ubiquinol oxidase subunit II
MLETIWFILWGLLWAFYFMLDGFDLGIGILAPFIAKNDTEKGMVYQSIGPFWDGNEVWLITAGGVTFAAFPDAYAVLFSSLYTPLMLILFALIMRAVAFEFRNKRPERSWRSLWDACAFIGSFVPALLFGVAFANIFKGIPIDADGIYQGNLFTLLNPYGLAGGLFFLFLFLTHGSLWLAIKSDGAFRVKAGMAARNLWFPLLVLAVTFLLLTAFYTNLYGNYLTYPVLFIIPLMAVYGLLMVRIYIGKASWWKAWFSSALSIVASTMFGVAGLYPSLLPSSLNPSYSLTVSNASSSPLTLTIMLVVALTFIPIVIIYQAWAYNLFRHKIKKEDMEGY